MKMKVSIIIPVYNAEAYLTQTIESVISQTHNELEVILVNDGSTDKTNEICNFYKKVDNRVKLIDIINSGPGFARNIGMSKAQGVYIAFVDADDQISHNAIEILLTIALKENYDVVSSNHFRIDKSKQISKNNYKTGEINKKGLKEHIKNYDLFKTSSSFGYVWGKLYKKEFLIRNNIIFSEERKVFLEDSLFNLKVIAFNPKYYVLNIPLYHYNIVENSLSNTQEEVSDKSLVLIKHYEKFLAENYMCSENLDLLSLLIARNIAWSLFKTMESKLNFKALFETVKKFSTDKIVKRVFSNRRVLKEITSCRDILQIILYSFIVLSIRYKMNILLTLSFFIAYPLFKIYINMVLKS